MEPTALDEIRKLWNALSDTGKNSAYVAEESIDMRTYEKGGDSYYAVLPTYEQDCLLAALGNNAATIIADMEFAKAVRDAVWEKERCFMAFLFSRQTAGETEKAQAELDNALDRLHKVLESAIKEDAGI